jgi:hypothetical protein
MLIILIATTWLLIAAFVVLLCRGAARADAVALDRHPLALDSHPENRARPALMQPGLVVYDTRRGRDPRLRAGRASGSGVAVGAGRGFRVRGVRGRGGRCVAGS